MGEAEENQHSITHTTDLLSEGPAQINSITQTLFAFSFSYCDWKMSGKSILNHVINISYNYNSQYKYNNFYRIV